MKSKERHKLQHNQLADWLANAIVKLKPYQNLITAAIVAVILAAAGYAWISHSTEASNAQAWDALNKGLESGNPGSFTPVIDEYPGTNVADVATVIAADLRLADGCDRLFHDKALAEQQLKQAIELYGKVRSGGNPSLQQRATFGLARAWEAEGEIEQATRLYQEVVATWPNGAYAATAQQRLDDLKRPTVKQLYADLRKFAPKTVASPESEVPGPMPSFAPDGIPANPPTDVLPANPPPGRKDIKFEDLGGKGKETGKKK